ncbi:MAG: ABC transporter ATP-binding protein [Rhodobacteraceae bacterium]|nr:ABC transporter ATP-binding protein [Paracoccaceae bacterium]
MTLFEGRNLDRRFGGIHAVRDVSFAVEEGEIFTIIGPNGAGKSTLFNLISRIYDLGGGSLVYDDRDISRIAPHKVVGLGIARTFQNIELFENSTVLSNLLVGRHSRGGPALWQELLFTSAARQSEIAHRERVEDVIDLLDLQEHRDARVGGLPYGIRKVVELGRALASQPRLILLDEPSSGLNPDETEDMSYWIRDIRSQLGVTVLMIEHDMSLVGMVSDRVLALDHGEVLAIGQPAEIMANPRVIEAYLGG